MDLHRKQRSLPTPRPFFTLAAIWLALAAMLVFPHACVVSSPSVACLPCPCANGLTRANGLCVPPEQQTNPLSFCFADGQTSDGLLTEPLHQETTPKDAATPEEITPSEDAATPEEITLSEEATTPEESTLIEPSPEEATTEPNPEISPDTRCTDDTDCPTGSICLTEKGECAPSECTPTRPCNGFLACINGRCQACQVDDQCKPRGTGYFCLDGICIRKAVLTNNVYAWSDGTYASDCMQYRYPTLGFEPASQDGVYRIQPPGESPFLTHCMMRYAGGGWTLTLRIDGQKQNFSYSEPLWTNRNSTANIASPDALAKEEVKPPSYWSLPFQQILLHNASSPKSTPLILNATAASTLA
ncbi:hypothetical protein L6R29_17630, partial [Myxococcota bacterium]|nr:hypothetical protein [Myxococcota bacterium]